MDEIEATEFLLDKLSKTKTNDEFFFSFVKSLLEIDPNLRLTAAEALKHPFLTEAKYSIN